MAGAKEMARASASAILPAKIATPVRQISTVNLVIFLVVRRKRFRRQARHGDGAVATVVAFQVDTVSAMTVFRDRRVPVVRKTCLAMIAIELA